MTEPDRPSRRHLFSFVRGNTLSDGLLQSHLSLVALGGLSVLVVVIGVLYLSARVNVAFKENEPVATATVTLMEGIHATNAALNGWVVTHDPAYLLQWEEAWNGSVTPAADALSSLLGEDPSVAIDRLRDDLRLLHETQWWIQDIATDEGAEPAHVLLHQWAERADRDIEYEVTEAIEALVRRKNRAAHVTALKLLADVRFHASRAVSALSEFVDSGRSPFELQYRWHFVQATDALGRAVASLPEGDPRDGRLATLKNRLGAFSALAERILTVRKSDGWNVPRSLLMTEAAPATRRILDRLADLKSTAFRRSAEDVSAATVAAQSALGVGAAILIYMALAGIWISVRSAKRIAGPVRTLMGTIQRIEQGETDVEMEPTGYEEQARLITAFNDMRRSIHAKENELIRSEARYRALIERSSDAAVIAARDGRIVDVNEAAQRLLGRSRDELLAMSFRDIHPLRDLARYMEAFAAMWETGSVRVDDAWVINGEGTAIPVSINASIVDVGEDRLALGNFRDMSPLRAAEEQTRLFRRMVDSAGDAILVADPVTSAILYANEGAAKSLGYEMEEMTGVKALDYIVPVDGYFQWEEHVEDVRRRGTVTAVGRHRRRDGTTFPVEVTVQLPVYDGKEYMLAVARDISERRRREEMERAARRLEEQNVALKEFNAVVSHDLKAPLTGILGFTERLQTKHAANLNPTGIDYLRRVRESAVRMNALIDGLMSYSWVSGVSAKAGKVELDEVMRHVLHDLAFTVERHQGVVEVGPLPTVYGDPTLLRQAFQNVVSNALKYRRPDVPPVIRVFHDASADREATVAVTVADNGVGFGPGDEKKIFGIFERLHRGGEYEGIGLGLATTMKIVERHGGGISACGVKGEGASFTLTLPKWHAEIERGATV